VLAHLKWRNKFPNIYIKITFRNVSAVECSHMRTVIKTVLNPVSRLTPQWPQTIICVYENQV
jgi:hypothetical protein